MYAINLTYYVIIFLFACFLSVNSSTFYTIIKYVYLDY